MSLILLHNLIARYGLFLVVLLLCVNVSTETNPDFFAYLTTHQPRDSTVYIRIGEFYILDCHISLAINPNVSALSWPFQIKWFVDGRAVEDKNVLSNGSLRINSESLGLYQCVGVDKRGTILSDLIKVTLFEDPKFIQQPRDLVANIGNNVALLCQYNFQHDDQLKPYTTWFKDDIEIFPADDNHFLLLGGNLVILNATNIDAGFYRCHINELNLVSRNAHVAILPKDENQKIALILKPENTTILIGQDLFLPCLANLGNIVWNINASKHVSYLPGGLLIRHIIKEDRGVYACASAFDERVYSSAFVSTIVPLKISGPVSGPYSSHNLVVSIFLYCKFDGYPRPSIFWTKNSIPIQAGGRYQLATGSNILFGQVLQIDVPIPSDSGYYQCWVNNSVSFFTHSTAIDVIKPDNSPKPPTNIKVTVYGNTKVDVKWSKALGESELGIISYSINYYLTEKGAIFQELAILDNHKVISNLKPYSNYTLFMVSYTSREASEHSEYVTFYTEAAWAPILRLYKDSNTTLRLRWEEGDARAIGAVYRVFYRIHQSPDTEVYIDIEDLEDNEYILKGLRTNEVYDVRMLAATESGFPNIDDSKWPWISMLVAPTSGGGNITKSEATAISSTRIKLTWQIDEDDLTIFGFKITIQQVSDEMGSKFIDFPNEFTSSVEEDMEHIFEKLLPESWYMVSILALMSRKVGPAVSHIIRTGKALSSIETCSFKILNPTQVKIIWEIPSNNKLLVTGCYVYFSANQSEDLSKWQFIEINGTTNSLIMDKPDDGQNLFVILNLIASGEIGPSSRIFELYPQSSKAEQVQFVMGVIIGTVICVFLIIIFIIILLLIRYKKSGCCCFQSRQAICCSCESSRVRGRVLCCRDPAPSVENNPQITQLSQLQNLEEKTVMLPKNAKTSLQINSTKTNSISNSDSVKFHSPFHHTNKLTALR